MAPVALRTPPDSIMLVPSTLTKPKLLVVANGPEAVAAEKDPLKARLVPVAAPIFGVTSVGDVARTTDPVPVFAFAARPLMLNELPAPAVS